jgi:hypothetical protein
MEQQLLTNCGPKLYLEGSVHVKKKTGQQDYSLLSRGRQQVLRYITNTQGAAETRVAIIAYVQHHTVAASQRYDDKRGKPWRRKALQVQRAVCRQLEETLA